MSVETGSDSAQNRPAPRPGVVSLVGLSKAKVLAALYNVARPQGMGFLRFDPAPMSESEAAALLDNGYTYFDYVKGRVLKVELGGDELETRLFNRDNGPMAAENAIAALK